MKNYKLNELCNIDGGFAFKSKDFSSEGCPIIRISNIQDGKIIIEDAKKIPIKKIGNGKKYKLKPNDILIAMSGATTGKVGIAPSELNENVYINQRVGRFSIKDYDRINNKYLHYFVSSDTFKNQVISQAAGVAQPNISPNQLKNIEIPLSSPEDQNRIVKILDQTNDLREKRKESIALLDDLTRSIFLDMFGDPVTNPKGWDVKELGEFCESFSYGTNEKCFNKDSKHKTPVLRIPNVVNDVINYDDLKYANLSQTENKKLQLFNGDLLFVRSNGNPEYIARCAVYSEKQNTINPVFASYLIRARLKDFNTLLPIFIQKCISNESFRKTILSQTQTTAGNFNINTKKLKSFKMILPPIELQKNYIKKFNSIEISKSEMKKSLSKLDNQFNSLMQKAFKGEL